jgi:hypothetical protein
MRIKSGDTKQRNMKELKGISEYELRRSLSIFVRTRPKIAVKVKMAKIKIVK